MISALVLGTAAIVHSQTTRNMQNAPKVAVGKQLTAKANAPLRERQRRTQRRRAALATAPLQ